MTTYSSASLTEKLDPKSDVSVWIKDFIESDAPQFKGKSKEKRKEMAIAAWYSAKKQTGLSESNVSVIEESIVIDRAILDIINSAKFGDLLQAIIDKDKSAIYDVIMDTVPDLSATIMRKLVTKFLQSRF